MTNRYFPRQFVLVAHQREPRNSCPLAEPPAHRVSVHRWTSTVGAPHRPSAFHPFLVLCKLRNAPVKLNRRVFVLVQPWTNGVSDPIFERRRGGLEENILHFFWTFGLFQKNLSYY